ncbi:MAG: hypothetical protein LBI33_12635 [Propionibacteriaceae bacterium]|jgi:hypothetical protein|nr:hypothetical protein [Propionibacteriaceae bacterium]
MSLTVSVRLGQPVEEAADTYLATTGWSKTALINTALNEWLRMQSHPGVRFVPTPAGDRIAALVRGPAVWTVAESWNQHDERDRTVDNVTASTGLTRAEVDIALGYYADHTAEIDAQIARVHRAQTIAREAWERRQALHG